MFAEVTAQLGYCTVPSLEMDLSDDSGPIAQRVISHVLGIKHGDGRRWAACRALEGQPTSAREKVARRGAELADEATSPIGRSSAGVILHYRQTTAQALVINQAGSCQQLVSIA